MWLVMAVLELAWLGISFIPFAAVAVVRGAGMRAKDALAGRRPPTG